MTAIQLAERAILDAFERMGKRAGDHIQVVALMALLDGSAPYDAADMNAALQVMADKGWIEPGRQNSFVLLPAGEMAI